MDLCGEFITHKIFGRGQIVEINDSCVTVLFESSNEKRNFIYPSSIGTFLSLENKEAARQMQEYKDKIAEAKALEQKLAEKQRQEEKLEAQNQLKLAKKSARKKSAASTRKSK